MVQERERTSLFAPGSMTEGGAPVDQNLTWVECRFDPAFEYVTKDGTVVATTLAARVVLKGDDGQEHIQHYSVGDPSRFSVSEDGKRISPAADGARVGKGSKFGILIVNLVNAGFPEDRLPVDNDISVFDGLYAHHIGIPEPKYEGLRGKPVDPTARPRLISVPDKVLRLPWETAKGAAGTSKAATPPAAKRASAKAQPTAVDVSVDEASATALEQLEAAITESESGAVTRQVVAARIIRKVAPGNLRNAAAKYVFSAEFKELVGAQGYALDGESITRVE